MASSDDDMPLMASKANGAHKGQPSHCVYQRSLDIYCPTPHCYNHRIESLRLSLCLLSTPQHTNLELNSSQPPPLQRYNLQKC